TIFTTQARQAAQDYYAAHSELSRNWGPNVLLPRDKGLWEGEVKGDDDRFARDDRLWHLNPPITVNFQQPGQYGKYDVAQIGDDEKARYGEWQVPFQTRYRRNWDQPRKLVNEVLGVEYTMDDFI